MYATPTASSSQPSTPRQQRQPSSPASNKAAFSAGLLESGRRQRGSTTQQGSALATDAGPATPRRARKLIIRRKPLKEKAMDYVKVTLQVILEDLSLDSFGYPLALAAHVIHAHTLRTEISSYLWSWVFVESSAADRSSTGSLFSISNSTFIFFLLFTLSLANTWYLLTRSRTYIFNYHLDPLDSPNAHLDLIDLSSYESDPAPSWRQRFLQEIGWENAAPSITGDAVYQIQKLHVWTPEDVVYSGNFYSIYPPPMALLYHALSSEHAGPFVFFSGVLMIYLNATFSRRYATLSSDRMKIASEVAREYNMKFVHPQTSKSMVSAETMTDAAVDMPMDPVQHSQMDEEGEYRPQQLIVARGSARKSIRR